MPHKIIEKKNGEIRLEIEVEKEKLEAAAKLVAEELGKSVSIPGFRPGKAPSFMIEKEVGSDRFWAEVIDKVVPEAYFEALIKEKIQAISAPQITVSKFVAGELLIFEAKTALMPEIKDLKYKDLKLKEEKQKITDKEIEEALKNITERSAQPKEVDRLAKEGDRVEIDFLGTLKGIPFEGGESKNHPLVLGSGMMIPGFEEKIIGKKPGEEFDFDITFPKEYHAANLAGQKVNFKVKLIQVAEMVTPEVNDDFAKNFGIKDLATLKSEIEKELLFEKELAEKRRVEEEIMTKIIEKNKIEAPETIVVEEIHRMIHEAEHNLSHSGLTMEKFLEMSKKTISDLESEMKPEAEKRVKIGIILGEVSRLEDIKVSENEITSEIDRIISLSTEVTEEDLRAAYETPERKREIGNQLIVKKALDKLFEYNVSTK